MKGKTSLPVITLEHKRDAYGFAVRPQHLQRYREYANIYKEEEEERSDRWNDFLERQAESAQLAANGLYSEQGNAVSQAQDTSIQEEERVLRKEGENGVLQNGEKCENLSTKTASDETLAKKKRIHRVQTWAKIRSSLGAIEYMMRFRLKKKNTILKDINTGSGEHLTPIDEARPLKGASEDESEEEFYDVERSDPIQDVPSGDGVNASTGGNRAGVGSSLDPFFPWKEELESLVRGGVPMAIRGELWQAFVGVSARRVEGYYQDLLSLKTNAVDDKGHDNSLSNKSSKDPNKDCGNAAEKWKGQIEKDLPRTFPGHPALDEDGRNALRRLLTAYARHNPSVGYCQAMNFFAGFLLLLMPEENAFWSLVGIIDDYFDGYYSEEMIESQVDQLVFEELVRQKFPKLVNHLDYLGVQVAWVTGPWFLSIFMNMLPWESVLRVWDVLLFDGNRVMLFRTALALMDLYGPALVTTKDAGDAITLLQSLASSTFDSSQLVLTACMGYQAVNETKLDELRKKHRPAVMNIIEERSRGLRALRDSQGLASKLYSFKRDPGSLIPERNEKEGFGDVNANGDHFEPDAKNIFLNSLTGDSDLDQVPDLQDQVGWLKVELCSLLEEKRSSVLRAEELETALMEMVKQDNRRVLSARVEQLEQEVAELRQALADKQEQEHAMLQVLMRVEQEQRVTEDARRFAEQDAEAQRYAANTKYEEATASLGEMEKRVVMAETMLEATLQSVHWDSSTAKVHQEPMQEMPTRKVSLLSRPFGLGWRDSNKGKPNNTDESQDGKPWSNEAPSPGAQFKDINGYHVQEIGERAN
ncbi:Rab-GTPase-TBC domain-containing protein [Cinnamomum micranthum f. kanehirae]|uniref:Rab-GTPase-TBC domain-containing protein n=1 Tax=Cinnamomum micranthum f. kanehirae TaxID=337451 RepID=A0A3S3MTJ7_9MAGN|nr:Rab-GTPase-TBC domain-containing protein [Cinnamomum micranthum f. kanehirae]